MKENCRVSIYRRFLNRLSAINAFLPDILKEALILAGMILLFNPLVDLIDKEQAAMFGRMYGTFFWLAGVRLLAALKNAYSCWSWSRSHKGRSISKEEYLLQIEKKKKMDEDGFNSRWEIHSRH